MKLYGRDLSGPFKGPPKCPIYLNVCHERGNQQPREKMELGEEREGGKGTKKDYASFPTVASFREVYKLRNEIGILIGFKENLNEK